MKRKRKAYTAQEMREAAECLETYIANLKVDNNGVGSMLRQAADMMKQISAEISKIDSMPSAPLDGAFAHQEVNGKRMAAKLAFFDKIKEILVGAKAV